MKNKKKTTKSSRATEKLVDVVVLGAPVITVGVDRDATVEDCLIAAGLDTNKVVKSQGRELSMDYVPSEGARLVISDQVKGGVR